MCRLYVFHSTEQTKVECTLVHAQNALLAQSREDLSGLSHSHGWGVATYEARLPHVEKNAWAAYHGEHFTRAAARIYSTTVVAHIRRATVGATTIQNTHPFTHGQWTFAHNGTVPLFDSIRPRLLSEMSSELVKSIKGETDSEHLFHYALSLLNQRPQTILKDVVRTVVRNVTKWVHEIDSEAHIGLNLVLTDGEQISGTRFGRTLHTVTRTGIYDCEICGFPHIHHSPNREHRAVVIASEPITQENWEEIPDASVWNLSQDAMLNVEEL